MSSSKRTKRLVDAKRRKDANMTVLDTHLFDVHSSLSEEDSEDVVGAFEQLVESYISRKQWKQLLNLFQRVDDSRSQSSKSSLFSQLLKKIGDIFFRLKSNVNALDFYRKAVTLSKGCNLSAIETFDN